MKGMRTLLTAILALAAMPLLHGKGETLKITISGAGQTVEIADKALLDQFRFGPGPGNFIGAGGEKAPIIHDWIAAWGRKANEPPKALTRYEVTFHIDRPDQSEYVVQFASSPELGKGYIHLPGSGEAHYEGNVWLLLRGEEWDGHWFEATPEWTRECLAALARAADRSPEPQ